LKYVDVYVDDFIRLAQGNPTSCSKVRDHLLTAMDRVFCPAITGKGKQRQEPISIKKLGKGEGCWSMQKQVLGWDIDTVKHTINLPPWRAKHLAEILADYPTGKRRVAASKWHKMSGELHSMVLAVPGLRSPFSSLQEALRPLENGKKKWATFQAIPQDS
jgi:hypothetical protein